MKAIKTSIYHEMMVDQLKSTIFNALVEISKKNELGYSPEQKKQYQEFIDWWMKEYFDWFAVGAFENIISKMVDERIDWKMERIDLWKQIAINTSKHRVPWMMIVDYANDVVNIFERKFIENP